MIKGASMRIALLALLLVACNDHTPDSKYATPEATIETLLRAYGVADMSEEDIQRTMRERGRFELRDEPAFRGCFADYDNLSDEGLAGFVFGLIAARKDNLRVVQTGGRANVFTDPDRRERNVVLLEEDGEWKISLHDSVPADVRRDLEGIAKRAQTRPR